jgi:hypothetical protein
MTTLDDGSHPSDAEKAYDLYLERGHKNAIVQLHEVDFPDPETFWAKFFAEDNEFEQALTLRKHPTRRHSM